MESYKKLRTLIEEKWKHKSVTQETLKPPTKSTTPSLEQQKNNTTDLKERPVIEKPVVQTSPENKLTSTCEPSTINQDFEPEDSENQSQSDIEPFVMGLAKNAKFITRIICDIVLGSKTCDYKGSTQKNSQNRAIQKDNQVQAKIPISNITKKNQNIKADNKKNQNHDSKVETNITDTKG
jgi:hypothetical protein